MFDFRYHALSLAAVLLALAVGVLLGVAIGDSNLVSSAKSGIVSSLRTKLGAQQHQIGQVQAQNSLDQALLQQTSSIAVNGRLTGSDIGLLFLGQPSSAVAGDVRDAVTEAGGQLAFVATVQEPLDLTALAAAAAPSTPAPPSRYENLVGDPSLIEPFAKRIGRYLATVNSSNDLLAREQNALLSGESGQLQPLQGLVVVRDEPSGMSAAQAQAAGEFESGLIAGLREVHTPAVGGELTSTSPSQVPWYSAQKMPSVDDLDDPTGRVDLVFELTGYSGTLGGKPTADSQLPELTSNGSTG